MPPSGAQHPFTLPLGYVDDSGETHCEGLMRRATARDEIDALEHPLARDNDAYRGLLRLSRTIVRIGPIGDITPALVESLPASDFHHLLREYDSLNGTPGAPGGRTAPPPDDETLAGALREQAQTAVPDLSDLRLSEQAARWMIGGDLPEDLVPMPAPPSPPATDFPAPASTSGAVLTRVTEGLRDEQSPERPSRLRLARTPPAGSGRAQQLAALSGGVLSTEGALSTVTFQTGRPTDESVPAAGSAHAGESSPAARSAASVGPVEHGCEQERDAARAHGGLSQRDVDELYELFLRRLRRDLLHDRERIGALRAGAP